MSLTALVTGASGFLGSRLARELHTQGWQVHVLARQSSSLEDIADLSLTVHTGDITDVDAVSRSIPPRTDAVFHAAASTNVWSRRNAEQEQVNVDGTRSVIQAAAKVGVGRLIHTSSFTTWGFQDAIINEQSPRTDSSDWINYVRTKHLAEQIVANAVNTGLVDGVILNPGHILGPGDRRNWSRMIALVDAGKLPGVPPGSGPFADVSEVARAHVQAFHRGRAGEKYLLGGPVVTFVDLVRMTGEILGKPVPGKATPAWILKGAAQVYSALSLLTGREPDLTPESAAMITRNLLCDSSRAQRELDYRFTNVRSLLQQTIDWMKSAGMLESAS
jgi:dihydroflavonol-4-reductase